jgi:hypothetical protein
MRQSRPRIYPEYTTIHPDAIPSGHWFSNIFAHLTFIPISYFECHITLFRWRVVYHKDLYLGLNNQDRSLMCTM